MNVSEICRGSKSAVVAVAIVVALGSSAQQREPEGANANQSQTDESTQIARSDTALRTLEQHLQENAGILQLPLESIDFHTLRSLSFQNIVLAPAHRIGA